MLSEEYYEEHLTDNGWITGTCKYDNGEIDERKISEYIYMTLVFHEDVGAIGATPKHSVDVYIKRDVDKQKLDALLKMYGKVPKEYEGWHVDITW